MKTRKIVLNTFGSLGDLHPYVALALELRERGYRPIIAANNSHRPVVEAEGIEFHAVRPDVGDFGNESELMKKVMDLKSGPEYVIRQLLMPNLAASYADLNAACEGADLLVTHCLLRGTKRVHRGCRFHQSVRTELRMACITQVEQFRRKEMLKILVAEDDHNLAHYYEMLLSQWNCETVIEHTGTDAILRAATFRPDVALLGVVIPEMGGVEAAIKLLETCPGTKIVLVTESVPPETLEQLATQGYHFETLPAPFSREELHAVMFGDAQGKVLK